MYKIKGEDGKEYGPITGDMVRLWLAEGRLYAQTPVKREGDAQWQPLRVFQELAVPAAPPVMAARPEPDSALSTLIPYKNVPALTSYYLGVFSIIPLVGLLLGIAAVVLGIM